jgi:hypothetical protein
MAIKLGAPSEGGKDFSAELPTADVHVGVLIGVWDIKFHPVTWDGLTTMKRKVMMLWEVDELMPDDCDEKYKGKHKCIMRRYNASLHEKAPLRAAVKAIRGKDFVDNDEIMEFDLESLIGKANQLEVVHVESNGKKYSNVEQVSKLMKGVTVFKPDNLYTQGATPEWVQKIIDKGQDDPVMHEDDDLPM